MRRPKRLASLRYTSGLSALATLLSAAEWLSMSCFCGGALVFGGSIFGKALQNGNAPEFVKVLLPINGGVFVVLLVLGFAGAIQGYLLVRFAVAIGRKPLRLEPQAAASLESPPQHTALDPEHLGAQQDPALAEAGRYLRRYLSLDIVMAIGMCAAVALVYIAIEWVS